MANKAIRSIIRLASRKLSKKSLLTKLENQTKLKPKTIETQVFFSILFNSITPIGKPRNYESAIPGRFLPIFFEVLFSIMISSTLSCFIFLEVFIDLLYPLILHLILPPP